MNCERSWIELGWSYLWPLNWFNRFNQIEPGRDGIQSSWDALSGTAVITVDRFEKKGENSELNVIELNSLSSFYISLPLPSLFPLLSSPHHLSPSHSSRSRRNIILLSDSERSLMEARSGISVATTLTCTLTWSNTTRSQSRMLSTVSKRGTVSLQCYRIG